jgi:hypothetical protein
MFEDGVSLYYHFYVECRTPDGWAVPRGFEPEPWAFRCYSHLGEFAFARPRWRWVDLFWGPEALFPMRQGPPEDRRGSPLFQYLDTFFDYEREWRSLYWLPYEELLVDCWDTETVLARAKVPARYALLFGDGRSPLPRAELLAAGMKEEELPGPWHNTRLTREPLDMTFGPDRFRVSGLPPEREVEVTWRETISGFMGERDAGAFRRLRRYGPGEDLRLLATYG